MTIKKVFFDANIFNDVFDTKRATHALSKKAFAVAMQNKHTIFTSCDIATNIYYITSKYTIKENALNALESVKNIAQIIPFADAELTKAIALMRKDSDYIDFEDTIQYILSLESKCDVIVTNDKKFVGKELRLLSSEMFVEEFL